MIIDSFKGKYSFLSNYAKCPFPLAVGTKEALTVEALFQANKTRDPVMQDRILLATPAAAKKLGAKVELREDWEDVKVGIMRYLLTIKFPSTFSLPNGTLSEKLVATGSATLVEGNDWGDRFWGCTRENNSPWTGANMLGILLMDRRKQLIEGGQA